MREVADHHQSQPLGRRRDGGGQRTRSEICPGLLCLDLAPGRTQVLPTASVSSIQWPFWHRGPVSWKMNRRVGGWFRMTQLGCIRAHPLLCGPQTGDPAVQCLHQALSQWDDPDAPAQCVCRCSPGGLLHTGSLLEVLPTAGASLSNGRHRTLMLCRESNSNYGKKMHKHNLKECIEYHLSLIIFGWWNCGRFHKFSVFPNFQE